MRRLRDAEGRRRLVHDHELGVPQHGLGDRDRLALPARQRRDRLANRADGGDREAAQRLAGRLLHLVLVRARSGAYVSRPRNMFWTMSRLSQSARSWCTVSMPSAAASRGVRMCTGRPSQMISPRVGRVDPGDALDQHRLARAVVAGQRGHLAGRDVEIDVDERLHRAEVLVDPVQPEQWFAESLIHRAAVPAPAQVDGSAHELLLDPGCGARGRDRRDAQRRAVFTAASLMTVAAMLSVVTHVGREQHRTDLASFAVRVGRRAVHQRGRRRLAGAQVERDARPRPAPRGRSACTPCRTGSP